MLYVHGVHVHIYIYIYVHVCVCACVCMRMFWSKRHKLQMCLACVLQKSLAFEKRNPDTFVSNCQTTLLFHPTCPRCSGKLGRTLGNLANVYCMLVGFCHPAKVRLISLSCRLASISVCSARIELVGMQHNLVASRANALCKQLELNHECRQLPFMQTPSGPCAQQPSSFKSTASSGMTCMPVRAC